VTETSQWLEERSTDADAARVQAHLDRLIAQMVETAAMLAERHAIPTVPDAERPDKPVNSL
jgi:hypothetical protein